MLHPSTKALIDRIAEMSAQGKVRWEQGENGTFHFAATGYRVGISNNPPELDIRTPDGRLIEQADAGELREASHETYGDYARLVQALHGDVRRNLLGVPQVIATILEGFDIDGDGIADVVTVTEIVEETSASEPEAVVADVHEAADDHAASNAETGDEAPHAEGGGMDAAPFTPAPVIETLAVAAEAPAVDLALPDGTDDTVVIATPEHDVETEARVVDAALPETAVAEAVTADVPQPDDVARAVQEMADAIRGSAMPEIAAQEVGAQEPPAMDVTVEPVAFSEPEFSVETIEIPAPTADEVVAEPVLATPDVELESVEAHEDGVLDYTASVNAFDNPEPAGSDIIPDVDEPEMLADGVSDEAMMVAQEAALVPADDAVEVVEIHESGAVVGAEGDAESAIEILVQSEPEPADIAQPVTGMAFDQEAAAVLASFVTPAPEALDDLAATVFAAEPEPGLMAELAPVESLETVMSEDAVPVVQGHGEPDWSGEVNREMVAEVEVHPPVNVPEVAVAVAEVEVERSAQTVAEAEMAKPAPGFFGGIMNAVRETADRLTGQDEAPKPAAEAEAEADTRRDEKPGGRFNPWM